MITSASEPVSIVFYDGVCVLCQFAVKRLISIDTDAKLHFAPLQGQTAKDLGVPWDPTTPASEQSVKFLDNRSGDPVVLSRMAAIRAAVQATGRSKQLSWVLNMLPLAVTNPIYRLVAAIRYRAFGTYDQCPLPAPEVRARFLP